MTAARAGLLVAAILASLAFAAPAVAVDPALAPLQNADAYVSPRTLGPAAADAQARLAAVAAEFSAGRQPVKFAIVAGPVGAPSILVYTRRLRARLDYLGTLVVTAPGRPVAAVGPRPPAAITRRLRALSIGTIANPTDRLIVAARAAVPPPQREEGDGLRTLVAFIGLAVIGGGWAVAWGLRREHRQRRRAVSEAKAVMQVCLDALRARAMALARREGLPPDARSRVEAALGSYAQASAMMRSAFTVEDVDRVLLDLRAGLAAVAVAGEAVGEPQPADEPFAGLCGIDPVHGVAEASAPSADHPSPIPVCLDCKRAADAGRPPARRLVPSAGRPVPFSEADLRFPEIPTPDGEGLHAG